MLVLLRNSLNCLKGSIFECFLKSTIFIFYFLKKNHWFFSFFDNNGKFKP